MALLACRQSTAAGLTQMETTVFYDLVLEVAMFYSLLLRLVYTQGIRFLLKGKISKEYQRVLWAHFNSTLPSGTGFEGLII
jgi:hypothetical protein